MSKQESTDATLVPLSELGSLSVEAYSDYCADLAEHVEAGEIDWDDAANLMFGIEPTITYTRWSA